MITISKISKSYGERILFDNVTLFIDYGERIGLVGPNGAGKSTLFSIIMGYTEPSQGTVQINKHIRVGYLSQEASFCSSLTVLEEVTKGDEEITQLLKEKRLLENQNRVTSSRYTEIIDRLTMLEYFEIEYKAKKILSGLGFREDEFIRPINEMSGGWQMRVLLAKLLTCPYDILLLDEPTNYLDLQATMWLKGFLSTFNGTFVIISHDQVFLNEVTNYTLVLENAMLTKVKGTYDDYKKIRAQQRNHLLKQHIQQEKKKQQLIQFVQRFHAQPNKASQVRAKKKMLEKMEPIAIPPDRIEGLRAFRFPHTSRSGYKTVQLENISKSYANVTVYQNFSFEIIRGEKAVLVGENGAGKSTLLKIIGGIVPLDKGTRTLGKNVEVGYFSQTRMDVLNEYNTVLQEGYAAAGKKLSGEEIRTILGAFLFSGDDVEKKVCVLSGGEKSRLILAKLLMNPPNLLLLDEPTTHLDADAVDALIQALTQYQGTIVFISHDVHFVRSVANVVFEVNKGTVRKFPGEFDYYWEKRNDPAYREELKRAGQQYAQARRKDYNNSLQNEEERSIKREERKEHNRKIANKIKKLKKKLERWEREKYSKQRIIDNPRHGGDVIRYYKTLLQDIEKKIKKIEHDISRAEGQFLPVSDAE